MNEFRQAYPTWAKHGILPPVSVGNRTQSKPSWQIARDISMDVLSRRATKLSMKQAGTLDMSLYDVQIVSICSFPILY